MGILVWLLVGLGLRLGLILYGEWQDRTMAVKFTDIDYHVFNDATAYVAQGKSPYLRDTYRYTPLLAWMLLPNIHWTPLFGKLLFVLLDIGTGCLIYDITRFRGNSNKISKLCALSWLFNPLPMTVSSRGNAESIMTCLVLLCLKLLQDRKYCLAGAIFSLSVHFKIYPVIYTLPIYLALYNKELVPSDWKSRLRFMLLPTKERILFIINAAIVFLGLTLGFIYMYGWEFLEHTYLYHVTRRDIRHNFSVYFYLLYQQSALGESPVLALLCFVPQVLLLIVFSFVFYADLPVVFFLNTLAFVTFNKVCTSQYFLWYLCLLPLIVSQLSGVTRAKAATSTILWFAGQGLWLLPAYYLEFEGQNTFLYIWLAGLAFFAINCFVMFTVVEGYTPLTETGGYTQTALLHQGDRQNKIRNNKDSGPRQTLLDNPRERNAKLTQGLRYTKTIQSVQSKVTTSSVLTERKTSKRNSKKDMSDGHDNIQDQIYNKTAQIDRSLKSSKIKKRITSTSSDNAMDAEPKGSTRSVKTRSQSRNVK